VVVRSVWDYSSRIEEFLGWCAAVGAERLRNTPELVAFDSDKRYLGELGVRIAPTTFVGPGDRLPTLEGEVVVKPNVSAGARSTGRYAAERHAEALALVERIRESGRTAIVQGYLEDVDRGGETALVFIAGKLSHVLAKRPVLREQGEALLTDDPHGPAARFGTPLYARVDIAADADGRPVLMELEAIEPNLYLAAAPGAAERFARAALAS
jgi:hypothetical protein